MKSEVERILRPAGIRVVWQGTAGPETFPDLVVVRFRGRCKVTEPVMSSELGPYDDSVGLGSTYVTDGYIHSYGEVQCDNVRQLINSVARGADRRKQEEILGRGLGRVLAHELRHMLLKQADHSHGGIAKRAHSARDLAFGDFLFDEKDVSELQRRWKALTSGEPGAPPQ